VPLAAIVAGWLLALGWRRRPEFTEPGRLHPAFFGLAQLTLLGWTLIALGIFVGSIHEGLHGSPDMLIKGNGSSANQLRWFVDRTVGAALPSASIVSLPLLAWRLTILAWSLWLATALLRWLAQGFRAFGDGGFFRDPFPTKPKPPAGATAAKDMTIPETPAADAPTSAAAMSAAAVTAAREPLASKPTDESGGSGPTS
jgi:hypothetical protein